MCVHKYFTYIYVRMRFACSSCIASRVCVSSSRSRVSYITTCKRTQTNANQNVSRTRTRYDADEDVDDDKVYPDSIRTDRASASLAPPFQPSRSFVCVRVCARDWGRIAVRGHIVCTVENRTQHTQKKRIGSFDTWVCDPSFTHLPCNQATEPNPSAQQPPTLPASGC